MNFQRGKDPMEVLELGWRQTAKELGVLFFTEKDTYMSINGRDFNDIEDIKINNIRVGTRMLYESPVVILAVGDKCKVMKCRYGLDERINRCFDRNNIFPVSRLPEYILLIKKIFDERNNLDE